MPLGVYRGSVTITTSYTNGAITCLVGIYLDT